jgi:hypothetical protein
MWLTWTSSPATILNYALTLEHLEDNFYKMGMSNFTADDFMQAGYDRTVYDNLKQVASDEAMHVSFLTKALKAAGAPATAACEYAFPVTDVASFLATASVLEGVGVSAYLGAAADIMSKTYLTAAGSILTTEARHSSYIRGELGQVPFAQPFDDPLSYNEVYTLAAPFITKCPSSNPKLPVKAFPMLTASAVSGKAMIMAGDEIMLATKGYKLQTADSKAKIYGAFITVTGPIFVPAMKVKGGYTVKVPKGVAGQSYVVLNGCNDAVTDDTIAAGPAIVEISS